MQNFRLKFIDLYIYTYACNKYNDIPIIIYFLASIYLHKTKNLEHCSCIFGNIAYFHKLFKTSISISIAKNIEFNKNINTYRFQLIFIFNFNSNFIISICSFS